MLGRGGIKDFFKDEGGAEIKEGGHSFRVWKNNVGKGGIKDFFKEGGGQKSKKGGII